MKAIIPGIASIIGANIFKNPAYITPFCPSAKLYWLQRLLYYCLICTPVNVLINIIPVKSVENGTGAVASPIAFNFSG